MAVVRDAEKYIHVRCMMQLFFFAIKYCCEKQNPLRFHRSEEWILAIWIVVRWDEEKLRKLRKRFWVLGVR
jgi:hypothetical protein